VVSIVLIAIVVTAAFLYDYHQQRRLDLPLRRREWHLLRLVGTALTGISALWFALAQAGLAGPRPLVQATRIELTPFGLASGPAWSEGLPAGASFFNELGAAGCLVLIGCTIAMHWPDFVRFTARRLGRRPE
jgi:hypothetical protein